MSNPLRTIVKIHKEEWPLATYMFLYFFLVISSFWILKPIKKTLFIAFYDELGMDTFIGHLTAAQAELIAKVLNMFVAFAAVILFTWLARRYRRQQLTYIFTTFFMFAYAGYSVVVSQPGPGTVWSFYLFGDLFSTLMVATFFAFLNDSVTSDTAKRLYGLIGLGGVLGGVFGSTFVGVWIERMSTSSWLWICFLLGVGILAVGWLAGRERGTYILPETEIEEAPAPPVTVNPVIEGAKLVFRSPYLLAIVGIVGLYEVVSLIMEFMFTSTVSFYLPESKIGPYLSRVFMFTNWVSMLVQFFLTSFVMTRFGLTTALFVLPCAIFLSASGFFVFPGLWVGSLLNIADNGFSYSINQSAKETLYVLTSKDEKYKAKAFIDMFVQRAGKSLAVLVSLGITIVFTNFSAIRWLSLIIGVIIFAWLFAVRYAGKEFGVLSRSEGVSHAL